MRSETHQNPIMKRANEARVALGLALAACLVLGFANREALSGDRVELPH
jgi:hypothetical protein